MMTVGGAVVESRRTGGMPIYEYKCETCHETFEVLQKFSDEPLTECILCAKGPVKKLISASAFILKGAGFYVNDYKKKDAPADTSGDTSNSTSPSSKASAAEASKTPSPSSTSESKPASTAAAKAA
jgi:putative FmdB family regulatory protein